MPDPLVAAPVVLWASWPPAPEPKLLPVDESLLFAPGGSGWGLKLQVASPKRLVINNPAPISHFIGNTRAPTVASKARHVPRATNG
jgi:hypothetical protein